MELTKYELARLIGARALQLSLGAPPVVKLEKQPKNFIEIAALEYEKGVLPLGVLREEEN